MTRAACVMFALACAGACKTPATATAPKAKAPSIDFTWKIIGHVMTATANIDERDAVAWNGREITISSKGYASPFQGTCEEAGRTRRPRQLDDVVTEVAGPRSIATDYDMASDVTEYRLTCRDRQRPTLELWVDGPRAMTCYGGVCYFLRR